MITKMKLSQTKTLSVWN